VGENGTGETKCVEFVARFCARCDILIGADGGVGDGSGDRASLKGRDRVYDCLRLGMREGGGGTVNAHIAISELCRVPVYVVFLAQGMLGGEGWV
jgi:hypothetical protein